MRCIVRNVQVFHEKGFEEKHLLIQGDQLSFWEGDVSPSDCPVFDGRTYYIFPGFTDVHVHLREPGFSYKETIASGCRAAARGGFTKVCTMPNLSPVPDTLAHLEEQLRIIKQGATIDVIPYASITLDQQGQTLVDFHSLAQYVAGFSDDGRGVQRQNVMREAMVQAKETGSLIAAHCEVDALLNGGYIHQGLYAQIHGHRGISSRSEWEQIERDIALAKETGCKYHVCHISCKESVQLIRKAKQNGVDISCETAPHYLILDDSMLKEDGRFKMNPPLRSREDREALIQGVLDGTIDMIATDHAPHSKEEKSQGLEKSMNGVVGLETSFPTLYTALVKPGILPLHRLIELMSVSPNQRFGFQMPNPQDNFTLFDLSDKYIVDPNQFLSMGRSTPFQGMEVYGRCLATVYKNKAVWLDKSTLYFKEEA